MKNRTCFQSSLMMVTFLFMLLLPVLPVNAALLVMPIRLVLGDRDRTGNITVFNTSGEETIFRMSWRYQKQREDGSYEITDAPIDEQSDLSKMLLFSPRQVTLQAGQKQRIRVSVRRPPDLADGEYRAHLALTRVGDENPATREPPSIGAAQEGKEEMAKAEAKMSIGLKVNVSYSLPVILRQGAYDTTADIVDAKLIGPPPNSKDNNPQASLTLSRSGKYSTIGKVQIFWTPPGQSERLVGQSNNVNIFPEISKRTLQVPLKEAGVSSGSLRIVYMGDGPEKGITFAEKTFPIGG